jgi:hypothetical protein
VRIALKSKSIKITILQEFRAQEMDIVIVEIPTQSTHPHFVPTIVGY